VRTSGWFGFFRPLTFLLGLAAFTALQIACGSGGASSRANSGGSGGGSGGGSSGAGDSHSVTLTWSDPGATSSNVYRSSASGGPYVLIASVNSTEFTDRIVAAGDLYCYVVTAVENGMESPYSQESCAAVPTP
jgi:hypothetical protein